MKERDRRDKDNTRRYDTRNPKDLQTLLAEGEATQQLVNKLNELKSKDHFVFAPLPIETTDSA